MERKTYLDRYRLCVDRIGIPIVIRRSADEATLQADDLESGGQVALQLQPAESLGAADREQLAAEARAAQQLDHVNIPVLRDFGFVDDKLLYVTELIEGITAEDWIKSKGPMPASAVLRIASQVVSALGAASSRGIFHYAVHPGNIMIVPRKTAEGPWPLIKLLNLVGVAPPLPVPGTNGSVFLNPADFASPEQLADGTIDFRSEIYSLGCTLWFLLKGAPLVGGAAALPVANGLFAPVRQLLAEMLAENPAERPRDPASFQGQIQDCLAQIERQDAATGPTAAAPALENKIEPLPRKHSAWKPLALAALFLAIATMVVFILKQRPGQNLAFKKSPARPIPSAFPSPISPPPAEASPIEGAKDPAILTASEIVPPEKPEPSSSDIVGPIEPAELAQVAPDNASASPRRIDMMASVSLEQEIMTESTPVVASNSLAPAPAPEIAAMEVALEQPSAATEPPPPAEGPMESEKPSADVLVDPPLPAGGPEMPIDLLIKPPRLVAKNISTGADAASGAAKKKKTAEAAAPARTRPDYTQPRRPIPGTSVGHMLFPVVPKQAADEATPTPSPRGTKKQVRSASR